MTPKEVAKAIEEAIEVTSCMVRYAKSFMLENFQQTSHNLINHLLIDVEESIPKEIVFNESMAIEPQIEKAARAISWQLAGCEAIWSLISHDLVLPVDYQLYPTNLKILWSRGDAGFPGRDTLNLEHLRWKIPGSLRRPFSSRDGVNQPISDPDLYLHELSIDNLDNAVEEALREAVRCFRHELYLGCLVLLGRASEAAWIQLGLSLAKAVPDGGEKYARKFSDRDDGRIMKKIQKVQELYGKKDVFEVVYKETGYKPQVLKHAINWTDCVRESRNAIHYGTEAPMPNSYEKVAALLIGAVPHFRALYAIKAAAGKLSS